METLFWLGWAASSILAYGAGKDDFYQRCEASGVEYSLADEFVSLLIAFLGPIGFIVGPFPSYLEGKWRFGLTYRIPKQKALPAPQEKGLVKQTGKEKVLVALETAKKDYLAAEKRKEVLRLKKERKAAATKEREAEERALTVQKEIEENLQKEISKSKKTYSKLIRLLAEKLLKMKAKHMKKFGEEEYQYLDTLIRKEVGLGHRAVTSYMQCWITPIELFCKFAEKIHCKYGENTAVVALLVSVVGATVIPHMMLAASFGTLTMLITLLLELSSVALALNHIGANQSRGCKSCHYLFKSDFLQKHNIPKALPAKKVKQLV